MSEGPITCIPNNEEKYISFSKKVKIGEFKDKKGEAREIIREIRFIDSFKFMEKSLSTLVEYLGEEDKFQNLKYVFDDISLLIKKGVFPYDYFDSDEKLKEKQLPPKNEFYSKLNNRHISDEEYLHAKKVWQHFEIKNLREYHDLYLKCDVLQLDACLENHKLDPAWYFTAPGLAWDALLKKSGIELELISDINMALMIEKGVRGGVSMITKRYAKANNKYMDDYNPDKESIYLKYFDANNLYGWAMSEPLPTGNFKKMNENEKKNWRSLPCILEVDLDYPKELHNLHNDYPMAPEHSDDKLIPN